MGGLREAMKGLVVAFGLLLWLLDSDRPPLTSFINFIKEVFFMYYIFEIIDSNTYLLKYKTNDLQFACNFLQVYKGKYLDRKFLMFNEVI